VRQLRGIGIAAACAASLAPSFAGCGPEPPQPAAASKPAATQPDRTRPASKRILGHYRMSLNQVPNAALGKQLAELKRQGKADMAARVEYTITDTEFIRDTFGAVGRNRDRFAYEILSESGDELVVRKHGAGGNGPGA